MLSPILQILILSGAVILIAVSEGLGYFLFIRPYQGRLTDAGKVSMLLMILTLVGGFVGAFPWWFSAPNSFAWQLPPLASRMLAAASWTFALVSLAALLRPGLNKSRLYHWMLAVYMLPLTIALVLFHLERLDFSAPITYPFLAVVTLIDIAVSWFLIKQPDMPENVEEKPGQLVRLWLFFVAAIMFLWGIALFLTDLGPVPSIWVWPGDLLTSRLISVMLLTISVGALVSSRHRQASRVMLLSIGLYGFGVAAANLWNLVGGHAPKLLYLAVFVCVGGLSWLMFGLDFLIRKAPDEKRSAKSSIE